MHLNFSKILNQTLRRFLLSMIEYIANQELMHHLIQQLRERIVINNSTIEMQQILSTIIKIENFDFSYKCERFYEKAQKKQKIFYF